MARSKRDHPGAPRVGRTLMAAVLIVALGLAGFGIVTLGPEGMTDLGLREVEPVVRAVDPGVLPPVLARAPDDVTVVALVGPGTLGLEAGDLVDLWTLPGQGPQCAVVQLRRVRATPEEADPALKHDPLLLLVTEGEDRRLIRRGMMILRRRPEGEQAFRRSWTCPRALDETDTGPPPLPLVPFEPAGAVGDGP